MPSCACLFVVLLFFISKSCIHGILPWFCLTIFPCIVESDPEEDPEMNNVDTAYQGDSENAKRLEKWLKVILVTQFKVYYFKIPTD